MKRERYTEEQIAFALRQAESGTAVSEIERIRGARRVNRRWKSFGGTISRPRDSQLATGIVILSAAKNLRSQTSVQRRSFAALRRTDGNAKEDGWDRSWMSANTESPSAGVVPVLST